ncbi:MAG: tetratricopeptide repeat protein [Elusimicrobiota bacterium]|nr:tetratricopeptide repeat protein [Elusimicrobiota bacterium]
MSRRLAGAVLVLACAGLSGCVATQKDVLDLSEQTDELKTQVEDLKKTVGSMQANQADLSVQIKQLREDLAAYTETVKTAMGDMGKLGGKLDELGAQISGKVAQLGQTLSQAQQKGLEEQKAALESAKREVSATDLFVTAEKRLQAKDFAQAAKGFEQYLKDNPKGELVDVATYDLGLAYYGQRAWDKAGRQFAVVLEKFPKSGQTPGARLHYALSLVGLKRSPDEARAYLESVVADFPRSPEAKEAAAALKKLDAAKPAAKR